jgi:hypothetical protein
MEVIRKIVDLDRLRSMIDIPQSFKHSKVEILILPVENNAEQKNKSFDPEMFFGVSNIKNIDETIHEMRQEWNGR